MAGTEQYGYAAGTNRLAEVDLISGTGTSKSYSYDGNGNALSDGIRTFTWNQDNRMISVERAGVTSHYQYNGKGQRVKKVAGGNTTIYHYDPQGNLIEETDGSGNLLADYIYAGTQRLAMVKPDNSVYYYHNDHLGTPLAMTNQAQQVVWSASYLPFGEAVIVTETVKNNFRFPGQYYDAETGLHYNYHRYYDPATGRYVSADPIGLDGGINLFAYVENNPLNWIDPSGEVVIIDDVTILTILGITAVTAAYLESPQGQAILAQNTKHVLDVIEGLLEHAQIHADKCNSSDPNNQNQDKWREEIRAALEKAKRLAQKRLKGKAQEGVIRAIDSIINSI